MCLARLRHASVLAFASCVLLIEAGCSALPRAADLPRTPSTAVDPAAPSTLRAAVAPLIAANQANSGFRILSAGLDGLTARVEMIDAAQRSLDLQYYIFRSDESGNLIAQALLRAVERGVRVRVILDDGETLKGDERLLSLSARPGIEIRIFNPFRYRGHLRVLRAAEFLLFKGRLDYRMHDKLMVADNAVAIIGGRNIGDQYFQIDPDSQFGDDDVVAAGPIVQRLSEVYDEFWSSRLCIPAQAIDKRHSSPEALARFESALAAYRKQLDAKRREEPAPAVRTPFSDILTGRTPLVWSPVRLIYDNPDKKSVERGELKGASIYEPVAEQANAVQSELLVVTPYFIPSVDQMEILKNERGRHARVRILTNSLEAAPDVSAHSGYVHYRTALLREGVELYEVRAMLGNTRGSGQSKKITKHGNYALHGKLYVFDRKTLFVGSMNFDQRSKLLNTEIGLLISSPELSNVVAARFEALTQPDNAYLVRLADPPNGNESRLTWTSREAGVIVQRDTEPSRGAWQRFKLKLLSILPLDQEL